MIVVAGSSTARIVVCLEHICLNWCWLTGKWIARCWGVASRLYDGKVGTKDGKRATSSEQFAHFLND